MQTARLNQGNRPARSAIATRFPKLVLGAVLVASAVMGCKKEAPEASPQPPSGEASAAEPSPRGLAPAPNNPTPVVVSSEGDINATLTQLALELRKYVVRTHKVPKNF